MGTTKTVSLRVDGSDLEIVTAAGLSATQVMREALHAKASALRARLWASQGPRWRVPPGAASSESSIRESRDRR
ncbi:MAG: hypothetical protein ACYDDF_10375 [Thermoplasmatota archaeon]